MPETQLQQISDHVWWMSPGKPDRPSLCAIAGTHYTLMLDAGASAAHVHLFLEQLRAAGVAAPRYVALSHWHWDHIFGAAELAVPVIAHTATAERLAVLAGYNWHDAALDQRVASGEEIPSCAADIKAELPEPRDVRIIAPDMVFEQTLTLHPGDVSCRIQHVGGDHAADSCVMQILPDRVLFLGDCLYDAIYTPVRHYTRQRLFPLIDTLLTFEADLYIEGHSDTVMSRAEFIDLTDKMRRAAALIDQHGPDEQTVFAQVGQPLDEDTDYFVRTLIAGRQFE